MKIPPVKGTRDFYPAEMAVRNRIIDGWKEVSIRNGFEEYDGPILEYLQMYQLKSGEEIVEQLFSLKDRGDRDLAIRPEITPTLARMVNQRINTLPKPIKWFSVPRLCRAERPQKGRFREFFQWNIDIIGVDDVLADAEVIYTTVDYLRQAGLKPADIRVRISSRKLLAAVLRKLGAPEAKLDALYAVLDKKAKLPPETFKAMLAEHVADSRVMQQIIEFTELGEVSEIKRIIEAAAGDEIDAAIGELALCLRRLKEDMGVGEYCMFDPGIVRGLAYYTGIVFEVHDAAGELRAICGGGRYDNLLRNLGGPAVSGTGMGMGDAVLEILLRERGLLSDKSIARQIDFFVVPVTEAIFDGGQTAMDAAVRITAQLRSAGQRAVFSYKTTSLGKQLKLASEQGAKTCIIIGDEFKNGELVVKDMGTGEQRLVKKDDFLSQCKTRR